MTCDPKLSVGWLASPVYPGQDAELVIDVVNGLDLGCDGVTASLAFPEGGATAETSEFDFGDLEGGGALAASTGVTIDSDWPENSYLPVQLELTDGVDTWTLEEDLVIGLTSEIRVNLDVDSEGVVQILVGVGDPDAPEWTLDLAAESLEPGRYRYKADLTDQHAMLPPGPGPDRWFVEIDATGTGSVTDFEIDFGDITYSATILPAWWGDEPVIGWLPEPPEPTLTVATPTPSTLAPGDTVQLRLTLRNEGADSSGAVSVTLSSIDADVSILDGGPQDVATGTWVANSSWTQSQPFRFEISAGHLDSSPVNLLLTVSDDVESWELPLSLDVPWVVIKATSIVIDDASGGNGDGLLDAGETAILEIELTNVGDLDADGFVEALLVAEPSSTADFALDVSEDTLTSLDVDRSRTAEFQVTVNAGATAGETLELRIDNTDDSATYTTPISLALGEPPWLSASSVDDERGDANGYTFDLVNVLYRSDGENLELSFQSAEPFDTATAFVEMWAVATSGDYGFYRMAMQSGKASLEGYDNGFVDLAEPTVVFTSSTEVKISWPLSEMDGDLNSLQVGFGAGWCTVETESFCDHFPDGWGYYYHDTYNTSEFFNLRW
jgi:hypothetical protein